MDSSSTIRIKLDDPLLSVLGSGPSFRSSSSSRLRMISQESSNLSMSTPSYYYRDVSPGAVPFLWESIPGTPKHPSLTFAPDSDPNFLPPLTPPPSFYQKPPIRYKPVVPRSSRSRFNLLRYMLRGIRLRSSSSSKPRSKKSISPSRSSSSTVSFSPSCSSSLSSWSTATTTTYEGHPGRTLNGGADVEEAGGRGGSLNCSSRFCFVLGRNNALRKRRSGHRLMAGVD